MSVKILTRNEKLESIKSNVNICKLFEEQVEKKPENTSLIFNETKITYNELNQKANQVASYLDQLGLKEEEVIGVEMERSIEMVIVILGILKAGAAYLPIDPLHPDSRKEYLYINSNLKYLVTKGETNKSNIQKVINIEELIFNEETGNLNREIKPKNLAYIIYTSGTTGKPKGVMIEHAAICNTLQWRKNEYGLNSDDRILQTFSFSFDGFVTSLLTPLISGSTVVIVSEEEAKDPYALRRIISEQKITTLFMVPTLYSSLLNILKKSDVKSLKRVTLGGEKLGLNHLIYTKKLNSNTELINEYGPTENSVTTTICRDVTADKIHLIGVPIDNNNVILLDENNNVVKKGDVGEICVSGLGLSRGYINAPELTEEKFFRSKDSQKYYRTGDLGRILENGYIEYLGRIDFQVKIRGHRIELNEIEAKLLDHSGIGEAIVVTRERENGDLYIVAYMVSEELSEAAVRTYLNQELPKYMVPDYIVKMKKLPIGINGKIDRHSLPNPTIEDDSSEIIEAKTNDEKKLISIFRDLLANNKIGVKCNFFHLGGHSLKAAILKEKIRERFSVQVTLREIFEHPTTEELLKIINSKNVVILSEEPHLKEEKEYFKVSANQKRLYVLNKLYDLKKSYNNPFYIKIPSELEASKISKVLNIIIERHEILRSSFTLTDGEVYQKVHSELKIDIKSFKVRKDNFAEYLGDFVKPFDLNTSPLIRASLLEFTDKSEHKLLLLDLHHIVFDGVSKNILLNELSSLINGENLVLLDYQFKDNVRQNDFLIDTNKRREQEKFWLEMYRGEVPILNLPTDFMRPKQLSFEGDRFVFSMNSDKKSAIEKNLENGITLNMFLLSAYYVLLAKYTSQEDIIIGTPVAGRKGKGSDSLIGMFVNTLPLRCYPKSSISFNELLKDVKEVSISGLESDDYQIDLLMEELRIERDISRNPLFDTTFSCQNMDEFVLNIAGTEYKSNFIPTYSSKFDISLIATPNNDGIEFEFNFNTNIFKHRTIKRMARHLLNILDIVSNKPMIPIGEIDLLSIKDKEEIIGSKPIATYAENLTLNKAFENIVLKFPNKEAVRYNGESVTYSELNRRANMLARTLREKGVKADTLVALVSDRSIDMIVGMMAILKAGGAYVPIDPKYPSERINYILNDSAASVLLLNSNLPNDFNFSGIIIDMENNQNYSTNECNFESDVSSHNLAYIIYTSGSTGNPKGVMVEHRNVISLLLNDDIEFEFSEDDRWTMFHSYCFDFSVWEMYGALLYGGSLVVVPQITAQNSKDFMSLLVEEEITVLNQTPSAFYSLIESDKNNLELGLRLRYIVFGGEALNPQKLKDWKDKYPYIKLINMYGITETTVHVTFKELRDEDLEHIKSNIGQSISTLKTYILDKNKKLVPVGVSGELYVGGAGVTRGYHNNKALTNERFIKSPFNPEEILYKSGDVVRHLENGEMEYLGREDHQVKIRGFRIELAEIEDKINKNSLIGDVAVIVVKDENGEKALCAYFSSNQTLNTSQMRSTLYNELPSHMIPSYFVQVDKWPLTTNGKLDHKALPNPKQNINTGISFVSPSTPTEIKLQKIWCNNLNLNDVGIYNDFFELGGHSLKVTLLVSEINKTFDTHLEFLDVYRNSTIKKLAEKIEQDLYLGSQTNFKETVILKEGSKDKNIFFIHGGNGKADTYAELCRKGILDFNCIGIQKNTQSSISREFISAGELAKLYADQIKSIQKEGPYYIFGTCIGGTIAFEIANRLEAQGENEIFIALASSEPPNPQTDKPLDAEKLLEEETIYVRALLLSLGIEDKMQKQNFNNIYELWEEFYRIITENDIALSQLSQIIEIKESNGSIIENIKSMNSVRSLVSMRDIYLPERKLKAEVIYYGAKDYEIPDKENWQHYCLNPIRYFKVNGDHDSIFQEPNTSMFSQMLSNHINNFMKK
ncbi:amino acid adenylation domain-containing protein [Alkalihalophilus lindianensis]|uniref:Amino acid adenylation domain-containing protein n=1 Tax=Alkalihalophilus lindianensis TaxID=1630542 RepID=A0ABU3XCP0_9BACI|nr:non-ribosomal peptide synthetase [Alkalihalophilus lindianensis]MDV2685199.1 amino acid adenylation domain-containing protein [Alkalihalophilus lindianensis]